jgi:hypothetical protein
MRITVFLPNIQSNDEVQAIEQRGAASARAGFYSFPGFRTDHGAGLGEDEKR